MKIIGLTGVIGAGKSTCADMMKRHGCRVFDADARVHDLMENDADLIKAFQSAYPFCVQNGKIDRSLLARAAADGQIDVRDLEKIIYPVLEKRRDAFVKENANADFVVLDAPLLFEAGWNEICDFVIAVNAPETVLKERVMAREGMTARKYEKLVARQLDAKEKIKKADYVVDTSVGLSETESALKKILLKESV